LTHNYDIIFFFTGNYHFNSGTKSHFPHLLYEAGIKILKDGKQYFDGFIYLQVL